MLHMRNEALSGLLRPTYRREDADRLFSFLDAMGALRFHSFDNGLFPAVFPTAGRDTSGYQHVWVRDNVHIAHAHYVWGDKQAAARTANALMSFFIGQRRRMQRIIRNPAMASDPMNRPHIRFDGRSMKEIGQRWPHAQNDALSYFLWLYCKLARNRLVPCGQPERQCLADLVLYLKAIKYWADKDSGHWEEIRKVSASSIGTVVAGLRAYASLKAADGGSPASTQWTGGIDDGLVADLLAKGESALGDILPWESRGPAGAGERRYDAALLFLIYPLQVVPPEVAGQILQDVKANLEGDIGVRRYLKDSYWCADFRRLVPAIELSGDFSQDIQKRDALARPGQEAQWCLFDAVIACIHGSHLSKAPDDAQARILQAHYLNRALGQLTADEAGQAALSCPEAYFLEAGQYVPNDNTPLQWAQANLRLALHWLRVTAP